MTSEIDKLKHFHIENYSGTNFTDDLNDGEEVIFVNMLLKNLNLLDMVKEKVVLFKRYSS